MEVISLLNTSLYHEAPEHVLKLVLSPTLFSNTQIIMSYYDDLSFSMCLLDTPETRTNKGISASFGVHTETEKLGRMGERGGREEPGMKDWLLQ